MVRSFEVTDELEAAIMKERAVNELNAANPEVSIDGNRAMTLTFNTGDKSIEASLEALGATEGDFESHVVKTRKHHRGGAVEVGPKYLGVKVTNHEFIAELAVMDAKFPGSKAIKEQVLGQSMTRYAS